MRFPCLRPNWLFCRHSSGERRRCLRTAIAMMSRFWTAGVPVFNPADHADQVGMVIEASPGDVEAALCGCAGICAPVASNRSRLSRIPARAGG